MKIGQKTIWIVVLTLIVIGGALWFVSSTRNAHNTPPDVTSSTQTTPSNIDVTVRALTFKPTDYTGWKTYRDEMFGLMVKYPPTYSLEDMVRKFAAIHPEVDLARSAGVDLFRIYSRENPAIGTPALVIASEVNQPRIFNGTIYNTIQEYFTSKDHYVLPGATIPNGELVSINGQYAIYYDQPETGPDNPAGVPIPAGELYVFLHNGRFFEVNVLKDSPYREGILQSIQWDK